MDVDDDERGSGEPVRAPFAPPMTGMEHMGPAINTPVSNEAQVLACIDTSDFSDGT